MKPPREGDEQVRETPRHRVGWLLVVFLVVAVFASAATGLHAPQWTSVWSVMAPIDLALGAFTSVAAYMLWAGHWRPGSRVGWSAPGHVLIAGGALLMATPSLWWGTPSHVMRCPIPPGVLHWAGAAVCGAGGVLHRRLHELDP